MFRRLALVGSREIPAEFTPFVREVVFQLASSGVNVFSVGDARGVDRVCVRALREARASFRVFSVDSFFAPQYSGRLIQRTEAVVRSVAGDGALVAFLSRAESPGSLHACRYAVQLRLPVIVFVLGFSPVQLAPLNGAGEWVRQDRGGSPVPSFTWRTAVSQPVML